VAIERGEMSDGPGDTRRERRRIDEVFGTPIPEVTADEQDMHTDRDNTDRWYLENRPPHHDR